MSVSPPGRCASARGPMATGKATSGTALATMPNARAGRLLLPRFIPSKIASNLAAVILTCIVAGGQGRASINVFHSKPGQ